MKYLFINSVYGVRSTGKIIADQCHKLQSEGHQCLVAYGRETINDPSTKSVQIGTKIDYMTHAVLSRFFDLHGLCSKCATKKFLDLANEYSPDVVWLHNLHGYYINIELLFQWLKEHPQIQVYWTLHDCWAFTGHCAYFTMVDCCKWKSGCGKCTQLKTYPKTYGIDFSKRNYKRKCKAFTGVLNMTLITPSQWLANLTRESFLSEYSVKVMHNTVDNNIFKPTGSDFRQKYNLMDKYIVLGVAVGWENTKGLPDILEIRKKLSSKYIIILVGATVAQIKAFPKGIIGITRTENSTELAKIYSASDVFVNPTHQDNYPTVNLEAAACGTPVITYNVGGSPESVYPENVIEENNIDKMVMRIIQICENKKIMSECDE